MAYTPHPIDAGGITLSQELLDLIELLARNNHDVWAQQRQRDGWCHGPERNDAKKTHPCLVPYEQLPESEKEYDRNIVVQTIKALHALGFRIASDGASPRFRVTDKGKSNPGTCTAKKPQE